MRERSETSDYSVRHGRPRGLDVRPVPSRILSTLVPRLLAETSGNEPLTLRIYPDPHGFLTPRRRPLDTPRRVLRLHALALVSTLAR